MPKQNRPLTKKGEKEQPAKPAIKIAKPDMTLSGFEHTQKNLKEKERLNQEPHLDMGASSRRSMR